MPAWLGRVTSRSTHRYGMYKLVESSFFIHRTTSFILHEAAQSRTDKVLYPPRTLKVAPSTSESLTEEMAHFSVCTLQLNPLNTPSSSPGVRSTSPTAPLG